MYVNAFTPLKLAVSNCNSKYQLEDICQRMQYAVRRSLMLVFEDSHQINTLDKALLEHAFHYSYSPNYYLIVNAALGPAQDTTTFGNPNDLNFLNEDLKKFHIVAKFVENKVPAGSKEEHKYTEWLLTELLSSLTNISSSFVMLDLYYLSVMDEKEIFDWSNKVKDLRGVILRISALVY